MSEERLQHVIGYHEATKHHPQRYARSLGYMDWATQPDPFRRFAGAELIRLPVPGEDDSPPFDALYEPGSIAPRAINVESVSRLLYLSLAISAWKQAGTTRWALRCNPSSGNLHPTEGYAVLPSITSIGTTPGVYHYAVREHGLERRAVLDTAAWEAIGAGLPPGGFLLGLSSIHWREAWKYGERAFRYCNHDVGHALGAVRYAAAALGWRMAVLEELSDAQVGRVLGLDRAEDFGEAEREQPDLIAAVFPGDEAWSGQCGLSDAAVEAVAAAAWSGTANRLSGSHAVEWEIIDVVAESCVKPVTEASASFNEHQPSLAHCSRSSGPPDRPATALQIIRQRRSAVAFDGHTSISSAAFYHMMTRVMPEPGAATMPWDGVAWRPRIHLFLFVHLVEGMAPGIYALIRDRERIDAVRAACQQDFAWEPPPECPPGLPLYQLLTADCRRAAAQLSLGQEIAGLSAFSLGMVADFDLALAERGPWAYRRLFWEAGLVGQVLYLEAEAAGVRATGIGAYFDDLVHEVLGMSGRAFQSLYHFTVGGPVDDDRLTTLAAYPVEGEKSAEESDGIRVMRDERGEGQTVTP